MLGKPTHGRLPSIGPARSGGRLRRYIVETVVISVVFYLVLFGLLVLTDVNAPTLELVFIALVPFIVLLVASGRIQELRFGDLSMKFQQAVQGGISPDITSEPFEVEQADVEVKGGPDKIERMIEGKRSSLAFRIGSWYSTDLIRRYLRRNLRENPEFRYVLFNERDGRFRGFMNAADFVAYVWLRAGDDGGGQGTGDDGDPVVTAIRDGEILEEETVIKTRIQVGSTLGEAMRKLDATDSDTLAVVDTDDEFVGVLSSENVTSQVLGRLMSDGTG